MGGRPIRAVGQSAAEVEMDRPDDGAMFMESIGKNAMLASIVSSSSLEPLLGYITAGACTICKLVTSYKKLPMHQ